MNAGLSAQAVAVACGAALGALARWRIGVAFGAGSAAGFPLGTLVVNALGGLVIGMAMVLVARGSTWHLFLVTGLLGGFTTFSAFSAESLDLIQKGQWFTAAAHTLAHVLGALFCTWVGYVIAKSLFRNL